ncbi:EamA family transporter [Candidatus Micrarchaeota archaeon]|nr:EamA family transporter [Candidatus Micrarchaeota archaeon]MBI5176969.1 EamA family transporter [Candidatus Micrarchaeota archaeon]
MSATAAIASAVTSAAGTILKRKGLKADSVHHLSYAVIYNLAGAALLSPVLLFHSPLPNAPQGWLYAGIAALVWAALGIVAFYNYKQVEAPKLSVLNRFRAVFLLLLGALLLGEAITANKIASLALILSSSLLLSFEGNSLKLDRNALIVLATGALYALTFITDKAALGYFSLPAYAFLMYLAPGLIIIAFSAKKPSRHYESLKGMGKWVVLATVVDVIAYGTKLIALKESTAITTGLLLELSLPLTVILGVAFLGERKDLKKVIVATALAAAGGIIALL